MLGLKTARRLVWGFSEFYCACGHHKCFHHTDVLEGCHAGICSCVKFIPETTMRSLREVKRAVESGALEWGKR